MSRAGLADVKIRPDGLVTAFVALVEAAGYGLSIAHEEGDRRSPVGPLARLRALNPPDDLIEAGGRMSVAMYGFIGALIDDPSLPKLGTVQDRRAHACLAVAEFIGAATTAAAVAARWVPTAPAKPPRRPRRSVPIASSKPTPRGGRVVPFRGST